MNVGFIGIGTMGSMLVQSLIQSATLEAEQVLIYNRTAEKAAHVAQKNLGMVHVENIVDLIEQSDIIFNCVKPSDYLSLMNEIGERLNEQQILISITSPVTIAQLESLTKAKIGKCIPSITNSLQSGMVLYMFGERLTAVDRKLLLTLFKGLGLPLEISERHIRIASDISSCGPAFISLLLDLWMQAAIAKTGVSATLVQQTMAEMIAGLAQLLTCGGVTPQEIMRKVAVPGGITAVGLQHIATESSQLFTQLIDLTHSKFQEDCEHIESQLAQINQQRY